MKKFLLIIFIITFLCIGLVSAKTYEMTLLTVGEAGSGIVGGTANAFLEVKPGSGRIFLDSFPLTKIDTQISTRYANKIACDHLDMDCSGHDFFYTIRADSTIVGGPSASGPLTILTIAALEDLKLREDTVMTGTINSGGSIGPVGGIVKKAIAAEKAGFKRMLIPMFSINLQEIMDSINSTNESINISIENITKEENLTLENANLSIEVVKVSNIDDALMYYTDAYIEEITGEIKVPEDYTSTMKNVAQRLCERSLKLRQNTRLFDDEEINKSNQYINNINLGFEQEDYYSAASYCFTLSVLLRKANLKVLEARDNETIPRLYTVTKEAVDQFNNNLEEIELDTLSELETYIIVKERLLEAEESLINIANNITTNDLAYAIERYYSAVYWSNFFNIKGQSVELDKEYLKEACFKKLSEAEERLSYAKIYVPIALRNSKKTFKQANAFAIKENYKMCLFKASFAKAEANLLLSSISVGQGQVEELAQEKLKAAKKVIVKEQTRNIFPILGYSYYEYANSLKNNGDSISALIFGEYSLELSNIEIYFPKKDFKLPRIDNDKVLLFASTLILGIAIGMTIAFIVLTKKNNRNQKCLRIQKESKKRKARKKTKAKAFESSKKTKKSKKRKK